MIGYGIAAAAIVGGLCFLVHDGHPWWAVGMLVALYGLQAVNVQRKKAP